jgi:hypothetical protein
MANKRELLIPNKFKITLFLMLFIPCITLIITIFGSNYIYPDFNYFTSSFILVDPLLFLISISPFVIAGLVTSYILGSLIDHYIQNERIKIIIAITSGLASILILYILYKLVTEPVICDPVHNPNNTICDPVHQPGQEKAYTASNLHELNIDASAVENSLKQCLQNLER